VSEIFFVLPKSVFAYETGAKKKQNNDAKMLIAHKKVDV